MTTQDFTIQKEIVIDAPAEIVWRAITDPNRITQWFADRAEVELEPGGNGMFTFESGGHVHRSPLLIETVQPPTLFSFRWCHQEAEEPGPKNSVLVQFTLTAETDQRTRLRVEETGLESVNWSEERKRQFVEDHRAGWATNFGRLTSLLSPMTDT